MAQQAQQLEQQWQQWQGQWRDQLQQQLEASAAAAVAREETAAEEHAAALRTLAGVVRDAGAQASLPHAAPVRHTCLHAVAKLETHMVEASTLTAAATPDSAARRHAHADESLLHDAAAAAPASRHTSASRHTPARRHTPASAPRSRSRWRVTDGEDGGAVAREGDGSAVLHANGGAHVVEAEVLRAQLLALMREQLEMALADIEVRVCHKAVRDHRPSPRAAPARRRWGGTWTRRARARTCSGWRRV